MSPKIGAKSIRNRGGTAEAFGEGPWRPNAANPAKFWDPFWDQFCVKVEKIQSEKASKNQCKTMSKFEAKGDPK